VRRTRSLLALAATGLALVVPGATAGGKAGDDAAYATITADTLVVGNALVERTWSLHPFRTLSIVDKRSGAQVGGSSDDLGLDVLVGGHAAPVAASSFDSGAVAVHDLADGGRQVTVDLGPLRRAIEVHPGVAGWVMSAQALLPVAVSGYTLDAVRPATRRNVVVHAFRAGSDWREEGWKPTYVEVGDAQTGDWRADTTIPAGGDGVVTGQWASAVGPGGGLFQVLERVDLSSSVIAVQGGVLSAGADLTRDLVPTGAIEGDVHVGNPGAPTGRHRVLTPGTQLERVFTGVAADADDEAWQYIHYLHSTRPAGSWTRGLVFNSDSVDSNRISTGAKDDMDLAEVQRQAAIAKRLGVDYFVLDDGWQARSGDWCPDSPACPESRPGLFPARFPDDTFAAVRAAIAPMRLGLWMSPMAFHPQSHAFQDHPEWTCQAAGDAGIGLTLEQNYSSSSEAGIGLWNPLATSQDGTLIDHIEGRIRRAIEQWDVGYFKFDFLWWLDCSGVAPTDIYSYREAFLAMVDRVQRDHPDVVIQVDETNDYRLWPFESISRGPTWFQNGAPLPPGLLHNIWDLAPYVPSDTIGQAALQSGRDGYSVGYLMAVALASHPTVKLNLTKLTDAEVAAARPWADAYHRELAHFEGVTYPLTGDPSSGTQWAALQIWDREQQSGVVLGYRQDDPSASMVVRLHGIDGNRYRLRDLLTGETVAVVSGEQLRAGYVLHAVSVRTALALLVDPLGHTG
jgi:hypothetical protein